MLPRHAPLASGEELARPATLAAEGGGADFGAGGVAEGGAPVELEAKVVVGVDHFCCGKRGVRGD